MDDSLRLETEKLARSWMHQDASTLRDYLVSDVEDPRLNQQSLLTRHFLLRALADDSDRFLPLMQQETRFAAALNWLRGPAGPHAPEEANAVLFALQQRADNAEGLEIPPFLQQTFASLPLQLETGLIPNYIAAWLAEAGAGPLTPPQAAPPASSSLDTFLRLWRTALAHNPAGGPRPSVLEPACGSANDYRFFDAFGLAPWLDYTGFDLCPKNVANALALFPRIRFQTGNIFAIAAPDRAYDFSIVHDLFEHLSLEALAVAVRELCRVTRRGLCLSFFNMDEIPEHRLRPVNEYHWNTLSMARLRQAFAAHGFTGRVVHISSYLGRLLGWTQTHNPNAYTFELYRSG